MRLLTSLLAAAMLTAVAMPTLAAPPFSNKKFVYRAEGKKLAEVLQDFAASQGIPIVIDPAVDGTVNGTFDSRPQVFLSTITRTYGTIWYFDGTTLFVYPANAMQSRVFRMRGFDRQQVREMLDALGLGDARFPLKFDESQHTLLAYGPARHIELVATVVEQLERGSRDRVGRSIQVFPLQYSFAGDRSYGNVQMPGLVWTLNRLFSEGSTGVAAPAPRAGNSGVGRAEKQRTAELMFGMKPPEESSAGGEGRDKAARATALAKENADDSIDGDRPRFQAEETTNSIIVRGLPERMKEYETLIRQLDVPQDLVEIEASIIDVSSDEFDSLGIDWSFSSSRNGVQQLSLSPGSPSLGGGVPSTTLAASNITTVIGNAGRQLLNNIRALESSGKARIVARPKVLGAVNRTATMVDKRVASVRVAGNLDANLFTIEAGTTLSVLPQIVTYADHREVRMTLSIQDGSFEGAVVDQVPIVKRTEINTEATIREGESLLIGGISVESYASGRSGVPGLSKLPLIGGAFRADEAQGRRSERLFLITPKVIPVGRARVSSSSAPAAVDPAPTRNAPPAAAAAPPAAASSPSEAAPKCAQEAAGGSSPDECEK